MATDSSRGRSDPLLRVRDLCVLFPVRRGILGRTTGEIRAVDGVSFDIARGTTLGLVGESGCGKTTVARAILRLIRASSGSVWFDGVEVLKATDQTLRKLRRNMQLVFQDASGSLNPRLTIQQSVSEPLVLHRVGGVGDRRRRTVALLERVGLTASDADRYPHELSGGQRQRVGIARAIALNPKFVVCDEPISALDLSIRSQILNLLNDLKHDGMLTYLFIAHDLNVVEYFCDRVAVMYLGRIVEIADAADLYRKPAHPYTQALIASQPDVAAGKSAGLNVLKGEVPDPINPPSGCAFRSRCPYATDLCARTTPEMQPIPGSASSHLVACHHVDMTTAWNVPGKGNQEPSRD